jgi:hypothetical protein
VSSGEFSSHSVLPSRLNAATLPHRADFLGFEESTPQDQTALGFCGAGITAEFFRITKKERYTAKVHSKSCETC